MKIYMPYEELKSICLELADKIQQEYKPTRIVAVMRGGMTAAHIISKHLRLPCDAYFPSVSLCVAPLDSTERLVFIEDLVAKGRTYNTLCDFMADKQAFYKFVPILVDHNYQGNFDIYGLRSKDWIVFPYEDFDKMNEGDHGLFRDNTDSYGKKNDSV